MLGILLLPVLLAAGEQSQESVIREIQLSHIEANVPAATEFKPLLTRDLAAYFQGIRSKRRIDVDFELLRDAPTQSGVSYPKYYMWVRLNGGLTADDRGAVRVAAIDKKRFEVSDFVSEQTIRDDPHSVERIFPDLLHDVIMSKFDH